jgi:outer membrane protein assembly factor BamD (BamD/ComL family)
MKKIILIGLMACINLFCFAQSEKVKQLVNEGIAMHDKGDYENALKKYDEAIAGDDGYLTALYEKSFTLNRMKNFEGCIDLSKKMIKNFPESPLLKAVYVQYGSALDDLGKPADAIKIYNEGLKKFPGYFLLHFNKGITYTLTNDLDKAYSSYQEALVANPLHASGYYQLAALLKSSNHIPAMLACVMHLVLEPQTERSVESFGVLKELIYANVKKTGDKNVTITMDVSMFDTKKTKKQPDNFRMQEMMFSMSSALDKDSVLSSITKTDIEKFDLKLQLLINSLNNGEKGFFSERYVPFFKKLKENDFTMIVSRLVFANTKDERNAAWLKTNTNKTDEFYKWLKGYKWPEG